METLHPKRHVGITIPKAIDPALRQYMLMEGFTSEGRAILDILARYLAVTPEAGVMAEARRAAFHEVRIWTLNQAGRAFKDIAFMMDETAKLEMQQVPAASR